MNGSFRGFIAIDIPDEFRAIIKQAQTGLRELPGDIKWTNPKSVHLTLKFLGQTSKDLIKPISETMAGLVKGIEPFDLKLEGTGVFPNLKFPRVIWIGLIGEIDKLADLQNKVELSVEKFGFPPEGRKFTAHLTLGRVKSGRGNEQWSNLIEKTVVENSPSFRVSSFYLFESVLKPSGAEYKKLASFGF
jgi:RNA 2',3'-cyclic 3'-phosphodiesterase